VPKLKEKIEVFPKDFKDGILLVTVENFKMRFSGLLKDEFRQVSMMPKRRY